MSAPSASAIVDHLHHAGLKLSLAPAGRVAVAPASRLTADLRDLIRNSKALLIAWLRAANDSASPAPDPPDNSLEWKELAAAYHAHHFKCPICISAGRGSRYGFRCGVGAALWTDYTSSV